MKRLSQHVFSPKGNPSVSLHLHRFESSIEDNVNRDLRYFTDLRQASSSRVINWLKNRALLGNPLHCGDCNLAMTMVERSDAHVDGYQWLV